MRITIRPAVGPRDFERFLELPWRLYAGDPMWVPPLRRDVRAMFDRGRNPFFQHAEVQEFLAESGGAPVGRIAAIVNQAHVRFHQEPAGFFGFFECADDADAARDLFDAAAAWLRERGMTILRGPMNFSTNDDCGSLVEGFGTPPTILMPHNPAYHARLYAAAGFEKAMDLLAYDLPSSDMTERLARGAEIVRTRRHFVVRPLNMKAFEADLRRIWAVYNDAWERNWGFVPMTWEEMAHMAAQLRPVVVPDLVPLVEAGGETVAFAIALPDLNPAIRRANGRLFPTGAIKIWWHARRIRRARVITLGIRKGLRSSGIDTLLFHELLVRGREHGFESAELSWVLEHNLAMRTPIERMGGRIAKVYRIYERAIAGPRPAAA